MGGAMNLKKFKRTSNKYLKRITVIIPLVCLVFILFASIYERYYEDKSGSALSSDIESIAAYPAAGPLFYNDSQPCLSESVGGLVYMGFVSNRSGQQDIWITYSLDTNNWASPVPVTSDRYNDSTPFLLSMSRGDLFLFFESDRPIENKSFNGANDPSDRYLWVSYSEDGVEWENPLQVTRNIFQQPMDRIEDSSPCVLEYGPDKIVLIYDHVLRYSNNITHSLVACTFDIGSKRFSQSLFDTYDLNFMDIGSHSMGTAVLQPRPDMGLTATMLSNRTFLIAYRGLCIYSLDLKTWTSINPQNGSILGFFNGLSEPDFFKMLVRSNTVFLYDTGMTLAIDSLNWTTWQITESKIYHRQAILDYNGGMLIAHEVNNRNTSIPGIDIYVSRADLTTLLNRSWSPCDNGALVLGDMMEFGNQSLLYVKDGIDTGGRSVHFVMAFDSRSGTSRDIMMTYSADGHVWSEMLSISATIEDEFGPVVFQDDGRIIIVYRAGDNTVSKYSTDLIQWNFDTNIPAIPPAHTQYFKRDPQDHVKINETGIWVSNDAQNWTLKKSIRLVGLNSVAVNEDRFLVSSQELSGETNTLVVRDLRFETHPKPIRLADTVIVIMFLILIVLIILALFFEIQR